MNLLLDNLYIYYSREIDSYVLHSMHLVGVDSLVLYTHSITVGCLVSKIQSERRVEGYIPCTTVVLFSRSQPAAEQMMSIMMSMFLRSIGRWRRSKCGSTLSKVFEVDPRRSKKRVRAGPLILAPTCNRSSNNSSKDRILFQVRSEVECGVSEARAEAPVAKKPQSKPSLLSHKRSIRRLHLLQAGRTRTNWSS